MTGRIMDEDSRRAVLLVEIFEYADQLSPSALIEMGMRMAKVLGPENFEIGRQNARTQRIDAPMTSLPPIGKEAAERFGDIGLAGFAGYVSDWHDSDTATALVASSAKSQFIKVNVISDLYTPQYPAGNWPLVLFVRDFLMRNIGEGRFRMYLGGVRMPYNFLEMTNENVQNIHDHYLDNGTADTIQVEGAIEYMDAHAQARADAPWLLQCVTCGDGMTPYGYARDEEGYIINEVTKHMCDCCGERAFLHHGRDTGEVESCHWLGRRGTKMDGWVEGAFNLLSNASTAVDPGAVEQTEEEQREEMTHAALTAFLRARHIAAAGLPQHATYRGMRT